MPGGLIITALLPFIKEMIVGKRLDDPGKVKGRSPAEWFKDVILDRLQSSRRLLTFVILMLALSLSVNYRIITKEISFSLFRDKEHPDVVEKQPTEPKETPTVPKGTVSKVDSTRTEKDDLYDQAKKELDLLYKEL